MKYDRTPAEGRVDWAEQFEGNTTAGPMAEPTSVDMRDIGRFIDRAKDELFEAGLYEGEIATLRRSAMDAYLRICDRRVENAAAETGASASFQTRVSDWMAACFLQPLYSNMTERGDRLLEEVLELLQATGYDLSRVATLTDYVYDRPAGEPAQEVGGVMVTLAGFCWVAGLDMQADGERELARIQRPEVMAKIRAKQEAKNALHFDTPLPGQELTPAQVAEGDETEERR